MKKYKVREKSIVWISEHFFCKARGCIGLILFALAAFTLYAILWDLIE